MVNKTLVIALACGAAAHSAIPLVQGDVSGAMTALGFNPSIPVQDRNKNVIEPDANTMPSNRNIRAAGLGTLNNKKKVTMDMLDTAVKNGGGTGIPVVNSKIQITYRQMVIDGRFDQSRGAAVLIDPTATGDFANAVEAKVDVAPEVIKQAEIKGTTVVGKDMPMAVSLPENLQCTGPQSTCLVRVINGANEGNQRWGGHFVIQKAPAGAAAATTPAAAGNPAGASLAQALKKIQVRSDEQIQNLIRDLKKIQVRDESEDEEPDTIERRDDDNVTYEDMLKFEAEN